MPDDSRFDAMCGVAAMMLLLALFIGSKLAGTYMGKKSGFDPTHTYATNAHTPVR